MGRTELKVFCPVPLKTHPVTDDLDDHAGRWALEQGLYREGDPRLRMRIGYFIGAGTPYVTEEFVRAFACYNIWGIPWDDHLDRLSADPAALMAHVAEASRVFSEPGCVPSPEDPWLNAMRASLQRLERILTPAGYESFCSTNLAWFHGQLWKYALQLRAEPPSMGEWLRMRWAKLGTGILAATTCPPAGHPMAADVMAEPAIRAFTHATLLAPGFLNDLASLAKETPTAQAPLNLVSVLCRMYGIGVPDAALKVMDLYERMTGLALRLRERLLADPRPAVAHYALALPQWLPAALHWSLISPRYLERDGGGDGRPDLESPPLVVSDTPTVWDPQDLAPPPYPELAWMWAQEHAGEAPPASGEGFSLL
ncbi:terpene synthase family protein [Actinomadura sp. 21ATH]|uniref:terpene synthase family protein n=1 Tax=Actinomadura sp. 21ATH TaxID=1735444 RepID=UPI0035BF95C7